MRRPPHTYWVEGDATRAIGKPAASAPVARSNACSCPSAPISYRTRRPVSIAPVEEIPKVVPHSRAVPVCCCHRTYPSAASSAYTEPASVAAYATPPAKSGEATTSPSSCARHCSRRWGTVVGRSVGDTTAFVRRLSWPYESHPPSLALTRGAGLPAAGGAPKSRARNGTATLADI